MEIKLVRRFLEKDATFGKIYVDGDFVCYALEDVNRDLNQDGDLDDAGEGKVYSETAIPFGKYDVEITFSPRFKKDLPLIKNVKGFEGIRIHPGNTTADTSGCILPGKKLEGKQITQSTDAFNEIFALIQHAIKAGEKVSIEITDKE